MARIVRRAKEVKFSYVVEYYTKTQPGLITIASQEFMDYVQPAADLPYQQRQQLPELMVEWFVFDYLLPNGLTPLQEYIKLNPDRQTRTVMRRLEEAESTQFATDFWLEEAVADQSLLVLQPFGSQTQYRVLERLGSRQLDGRTGAIGVRLTKIEDEWSIAGNFVYYYPVQPTQQMRDMLLHTGSSASTAFIDIVKRVFSQDDQQAEGMGSQAEVLSMELADVPDYLTALKKRYQKLRRQVKQAPKWEDIEQAIFDEDGEQSIIDLINELFGAKAGKTRDVVDFPDEKTYAEVVDIVATAWNLLPHAVLGGFSPLEMSRAEQGRQSD